MAGAAQVHDGLRTDEAGASDHDDLHHLPSSNMTSALPGTRSRYSSLDEGEQVGVHDVGMGGAHAVRELLVDLQRAVLEELDREQCRSGDRHDLVVVAMHHE